MSLPPGSGWISRWISAKVCLAKYKLEMEFFSIGNDAYLSVGKTTYNKMDLAFPSSVATNVKGLYL